MSINTFCVQQKCEQIAKLIVTRIHKATITLFDQENVRIFEYAEKIEAMNAMKNFSKYTILTYIK